MTSQVLSKMNYHCLLRAGALLQVILFPVVAGQDTNWFGLGKQACFGQTCTFGEFCSQDPDFRSCRDCDDMQVWCDVNVTHLERVIPTCVYVCDRELVRLYVVGG